MRFRSDLLAYLFFSLTIVTLFWSTLVAIAMGAMAMGFYSHHKGVFRLFGRIIRRMRASPSAEKVDAMPTIESEPTLITMVLQAPCQLLGISADAGTSTIFYKFQEKAKEQRGDDLKLNKSGRRLQAAKNAMLSQRRRGPTASSTPSAKGQAKKNVNGSLSEMLQSQPVYSGKVVQIKNVSAHVLASLQVGKEIEDIGTTTVVGAREVKGKGNSRFLVLSQTGRLLTGAQEGGQVVFFPGTKFVVLSRTPWTNPENPQAEGFTFELAEVA